MEDFDRTFVENVLSELDEKGCLFAQFSLKKDNNELRLLGTGGFSSVYEMYNKERTDKSFALKVIGFQRHTVSSQEFWNTARMQRILCEESGYIMRILDARELIVFFENDRISDVKDVSRESVAENDSALHMQLVLMDKLDELIEKNRFGSVKLLRDELCTEAEVYKLAVEVGQALAIVHNSRCLHRDIKIENIFWDNIEQIYKLGDFGIAKWAEDGTAETIVYTQGYGAPEIERMVNAYYNVTADIYSFGITLYLLLNELRFPGSDGYYSKVEVQYNPDFVFPAPVHASGEMTRVIRKMCSYYPEDRYQTMNEVLADLSRLLDSVEGACSDEMVELADMATETFKKTDYTSEHVNRMETDRKTRAERKQEMKNADALYRSYNIKYCIVITALLFLMFNGISGDGSIAGEWAFYILPALCLFEAVLQKMKDMYVIFGIAVLTTIIFSIYSVGMTAQHAVLIICLLSGCTVLTVSGALSTGLWIIQQVTQRAQFLDFISRWDIGWIFLTAVMMVVFGYFTIQMWMERITQQRARIILLIFDKIFIVMILAGIVLFILQRCNVITLPDILVRLHLVRTGAISFIIMSILLWLEGVFDDDEERENN